MSARLVASSRSATSSLCLARLEWVRVCAPIVTSGSAAKGSQLVPGHAEFAGRSRLRRRRGGRTAQTFRAPRRARSATRAASRATGRTRPPSAPASWLCRRVARPCDLDFDRGSAGDHPLQRDPPQPPLARGEFAHGIDDAGRVKFAQHRQRVVAVVAVAVVEREAGKAPREVARIEPLVQFVHRDDVDVACTQMRQHLAQERRLDLEVTVGLEFGVAAGANVVQHENGAHAGKNRPQQVMRAGAVKRFQAGANDGGTELAHQGG